MTLCARVVLNTLFKNDPHFDEGDHANGTLNHGHHFSKSYTPKRAHAVLQPLPRIRTNHALDQEI